MGEILKELPAVILRGSVLLPGVVSHFDISARKSIHAVEEAMNGDNCIFLVTQKDMQTEHATQDDVYAIGVIAEIKQIVKMQNHGKIYSRRTATPRFSAKCNRQYKR